MRVPVDAETILPHRCSTCARRVALYRLNQPHGSLQQWMAITPATRSQMAHALWQCGGRILGCP